MSDEDIEALKILLANPAIRVFWVEYGTGGVLQPLHSVQEDYKERPADSDEIPEPVVWIGKPGTDLMWNSKCIELIGSSPDEFVIVKILNVNWPNRENGYDLNHLLAEEGATANSETTPVSG